MFTIAIAFSLLLLAQVLLPSIRMCKICGWGCLCFLVAVQIESAESEVVLGFEVIFL